MSSKRCLRLVLAITSLSTAIAGEPLPARPPKLALEDFSKYRTASGIALSGDGKTIAFQKQNGEKWAFLACDWETGKIVVAEDRVADASTPVWVSDDYVANGAGGMDRTGKNQHLWWLSGKSFFAARFGADKGDEAAYVTDARVPGEPDFYRQNSRTGTSMQYLENPGKVISWMVDGQGVARAGVQLHKDRVKTRVIYRSTDQAPWTVPAGLDFNDGEVRPHWLSADGRLLYLSKVTPEGTWGLYSYDLEKQCVKELILSHTKYDIFPDGAPVVAPRTREILGFYYMTEKLRVIWFDSQMAAVQSALDQILPRQINMITSLSDDLQRMIVYSSSARDAGRYYRFDLKKKELKPLFALSPWIKPAQMAEQYPVSYIARDGLAIHGYLTLPQGRDPKKLPLVVLPHDGLWTRDTWGFDLDVQFLANRGYAVLQINYRGSSGYGPAFQEKAYHQIGRNVQNDVTDGTRWAINQGVADPGRIAIMGSGFGGYSAIMGAEQNPDLYACAIGISPTINWAKRKKDLANAEFYKKRVGDPEADALELADISPVSHVDQLKAPLLLIYDTDQDNYLTLRDDFNAFTSALGKAHKAYETIDKHNEYAGIYTPKNRLEVLGRIEHFLTQHMPSDLAGVAALPATK